MSAGVMRLRQDLPGRVLAWLYFTNSLGGAVGVLVAGFVLVGMAGLPGVLTAAASLNLLVALGALLISSGPRLEPTTPDAANDGARHGPPGRLEPSLLGMAFGTAIASVAYEIDWIRMLRWCSAAPPIRSS